MTTYTLSETTTFTITHAKYIASKVHADLKRIQRFYNSPTDQEIAKYEAELSEILKAGYLKDVTYGFKKDSQWIEPTLIYTAKDLSNGAIDDDPGRIRSGMNVTGASFSSFLNYNDAWWKLSENQKSAFKLGLPIQRSTGSEPAINGYLEQDRSYSSGGKSLDRSTVRSIQ